MFILTHFKIQTVYKKEKYMIVQYMDTLGMKHNNNDHWPKMKTENRDIIMKYI